MMVPRQRMSSGYLQRVIRLVLVAISCLCLSALAASSDKRPVIVAEISGAIGVGTGYYVTQTLTVAAKERAQLVILKIDTPGGLVSATREIIQSILASPIPVAVFVSPSGARAASAGTYMAYAAHIVAMAPGTHLGAATPIQMQLPGMPQAPQPGPGSKDRKGDSTQDAAKNKMMNDAVAYLRTLAQLRGRSEKWADKFVVEAATLTSTEALKEGVIDIAADNLADLLAKLQSRQVRTEDGDHILNIKDAEVRTVEANWKARFLAMITDPNVAFILLLIGVYGIIFEFWSPGLTGPGVVGGISLIVALTALSAMPLNAAGLALLILGITLMTAEAFAPGFGILGFGGIAAFIVGAIFFFEPGGADIGFSIAWPVIIAAAFSSALLSIGLLGFVVRERNRKVVTGSEQMIGLEGDVVTWDAGHGKVLVHGENWAARSDVELTKGSKVRVVDRDGLTLIVAERNNP